MRYDLAEIITRTQGPQRRSLDLRTIIPTQAMIGDLARLIVRIPRRWHEIATGPVLDAYAASINQLPNGLTRDAPSDIQRELDLGEEDVRRLMLELGPQVEEWVGGVDAWHRSKFIASVLSASGVDLTTVIGAEGQTAEAFFQSILALIRNIDDSTRNRIAGVVWRGFTERTPRREMARLITEQTNIERRRALRIASDQTVKLAAKLDQARQEDAGITEYTWKKSGKLHPRPHHVARDGKIFRWDEPPSDGHPGTLPNCFPSWQPVGLHGDVNRLWRRWHDGELTTIITDAGARLNATANHPVLTRTGWKPAHALNVGDELVHVGPHGILVGEGDVEQREAEIGQVFETAKALLGSVSRHMTGTGFHGDAAGDQHIDVVDADGGLLNHIQSCVTDGLGDVVLGKALVALHALDGAGSLDAFGMAGDTPPRSRIGRARLLLPLLWRESCHGQESGLAAAPDDLTRTLDHIRESLPWDTQPLAQRLDALTAKVGLKRARSIILFGVVRWAVDQLGDHAPSAEVLGEAVSGEPHLLREVLEDRAGVQPRLDKVQSVSTRRWKGHVFNLETVCGWYAASMLIVKNCGCKPQAHVTFD